MSRYWPLVATILLPAFAFACNDVTEEEVTQDVCWSKKRWIGGKRGSEHMYPGRDCVGCHRDNDGPEFIFGGTVYAFVLGTKDMFDALQSGDDCFGQQGLRVEITAGDGEVFETTTNEAGNFFFEGKQSDVVMPFRVTVWGVRDDGEEFPNTMATRPAYGGCGQCHAYKPESLGTPGEPDAVIPGTAYIGVRGVITPDRLEGVQPGAAVADAFDADDFGDVELPE